MNSKRTILLITVLIVMILLVVLCVALKNNNKNTNNNTKLDEYTFEESNGDKTNISEALKKSREEQGYVIDHIKLNKQGDNTIFSLTLSNQGMEVKKAQLMDVIFIDKKGNELHRMGLYIREIAIGETILTQATIKKDFTKVYDFKLEPKTAKTAEILIIGDELI